MIYFCSPYTHECPAIETSRYESVCKAAAEMLRHGLHVFSPIAHSHAIAVHADPPLPRYWSWWQKIDFAFLDLAAEVVVLKLDGWKDSVGVKAEVEYAVKLGLPVTYLSPDDVAKWSRAKSENGNREDLISSLMSHPDKRQAFIAKHGLGALTKLLAKRGR